ncbi:MAG: DUF2806 domain-containing protein [Planctomycetaceae bacterium]|nr:DUF2806 domain-containing protein [Planctomycetaceae bacterium]
MTDEIPGADKHSLMNIGDLAKPATLLIQKVSDAVGAFCEPWQIKRVAEAQADAKLIATRANIKASELEERALRRMIKEQAKHQKNMESITLQSLPHLNENAIPGDIDEDWIANFFDKCRLISDEQMQQLWSRVLAGEANSPGSFSKRAVGAIAEMDHLDATDIMNVCRFTVFINDRITPIVWDSVDEFYNANGVFFSSLNHLESIGIVSFESTGYIRSNDSGLFGFRYFNESFTLDVRKYVERLRVINWSNPPADNSLPIGEVLFTEIGYQLASICDVDPVEGFVNYISNKWKEKGIEIQPSLGES